MGSFGAKGGPPCETCKLLPSVYHSDTYGLMCNKCLQDDENIQWAAYWGRKFRTHPFFVSLRFMLLSSFWALDWILIVIVVSATQTGSFVDGFATEMISKQL